MVRSSTKSDLVLVEKVVEVCGWRTDMVSIDYADNANDGDDGDDVDVHTWVIFVPGNPGCIGWYKRLLMEIMQGLGNGYAARGISYAGHGVSVDKTTSDAAAASSIAWTIEGQVHHKITWLTQQLDDDGINDKPKNLIFVTHSIGAHLVHRMCLLSRTLCQMTKQIIHLMPFIRFDPPFFMKHYLSTVSKSPNLAISFLRTMTKIASCIPRATLDRLLTQSIPEGRELALDLLVQPDMATNFLELGLREIRELPQTQPDIHAFQYLKDNNIPVHMLYCGGPDHWAPPSHITDIVHKHNITTKNNVYITYMDQLLHGFVVFPNMIPPVVNFVLQSIQQALEHIQKQQHQKISFHSKL